MALYPSYFKQMLLVLWLYQSNSNDRLHVDCLPSVYQVLVSMGKKYTYMAVNMNVLTRKFLHDFLFLLSMVSVVEERNMIGGLAREAAKQPIISANMDIGYVNNNIMVS